MGNIHSDTKVNFEYIQNSIEFPNSQIMINVLDDNLQDCLINTTIHAREEEEIINQCMRNNKNKLIIIYGKNCCDENLIKKYKQLVGFGLKNVKIYFGGLFEWLCLQDIYGKDKFKTLGYEVDLLKYK